MTNFYGCTFILYELSSPFLNFHWFFDKLGMTGSRAQLVNGIVLLFTFFSCRLVWGTYHSIKLYQDLWTAIRHTPLTADIHPEAMYKDTPGSREALAGRSAAPIHSNVMRFARDEYVPIWLAVAVAGSNVVLNTLNYVWFRKMIQTLQRRFQSTTGDSKKEAPVVTRSTGIDGKVKIGVDDTEVRHRRTAVEVEDVPPT